MTDTPERIIVPLDGSPLAEHAIAMAALLARTLDANITLVSVLEEFPVGGLPPEWWPAPADVEQYLVDTAARHQITPLARKQVLTGDVVDELTHFAAARPDAIVVMTTHGRGGIGRVVIGSVADKVVRAASAPVVLVRVSDNPARIPERLGQLLVGLDGSEMGERALPLAMELARGAAATLTLARVVEPVWGTSYGTMEYIDPNQIVRLSELIEHEAHEYLATVSERLRGEDLRVETALATGYPAGELQRLAKQRAADLVLVASHGRHGVSRFFLGSVATALAQNSPIPVAVIPARAEIRVQA